MRPTVLLRLLVLSGSLTLHVQSRNIICGKEQYTVTNGSSSYCLNCDTCHAGYGLYPVCGQSVTYPPNIACRHCPNETFSDKLDSAPCYNCQQCAMLEIVAAPCTRSSDRICSGTCEKGYFFSKKVPRICQQCSYCCFDGKDEEQLECVKQGFNATGRHCSARLNKHCVPRLSTSTATVTTQTHLPSLTQSPTSLKLTSSPSPSTSPSTTAVTNKETAASASLLSHPTNPQVGNHSAIVIASCVLSGLVLAALIVGAMLYMYKKTLKRKRTQNIPPDRSPGNNDDNTTEVLSHRVAYHADPRVQALQNTGYNAASSTSATPEASPSVTPQQTDDEVDDLPNVTTERRKCLWKRQSSKEPQSNAQKKDGTTENLLNPSVQVQKGKQGEDSKGVGQSMPRRQSFPGTVMRKLSLSHPYQLIGQEDPDEPRAQEENGNVSREPALHSPTNGSRPHPSAVRSKLNPGFAPSNPGTPNVTPPHTDDELDPESNNAYTSKGFRQIQIVQQPKSQTKTEGSRLEFTCECQVQVNCEVRYQWLKDGAELPGQNNPSLVLDSVKMCDFGCYRCCISHRGSPGEAVTSEHAVLEVHPCEGKRFKYLKEVDLDTRDKIAILLENKTPGLGGYRQMAANFGMEEYQVKGLENSRHAGQDVMEFLQGSNTNLTVYIFCNKLKEDNMKRFDIVTVLEDHLSIEK